MLKINCDSCGIELKEAGGLVFSPPDNDGQVYKNHVCPNCWFLICKEFLSPS